MSSGTHILIVDDDANNRFMLVQRLRQMGFAQTSEADSGHAALAQIRATTPDLVLLDVMMPGTDGVSVLEALRSEGRLAEVSVIMVSAHDSLDVAARCIELGAEDYLTKPIHVPMLRARVMAVLERRRLGAVEHAFLTHYDPETHLPNRHALLERVDRLRAGGRRFALAAVQRREHGSIALGEGEGDAQQQLRALNNRMLASSLPTDIVARVDDGTLAWLLSDVQSDHLLLHEVETTLNLGSARTSAPSDLIRDCAVGIAIGSPDDRTQGAAELLRLAISEAARIEPEALERVSIADPALREATRSSLALHRDVERALSLGEFLLYFQPIFSVPERRIVGAEALLRWRHAGRGLLAPGAFLGAVEQSPLMEALDAWVMATATETLMAWAERLPDPFRLHVNVTARSLNSSRMVDLVERAVASGMRRHLAVELTERIHVQDMPACVSLLQGLRALGVHVALDDFGTGFSSLSHISLLPCDMLKIDRSFVSGVDTDAKRRNLLASLIAMAHALELGVVAEGVEQEGEFEVLRQLGCAEMQGYLLARPMPAAELLALLDRMR